MQLLLTSDTREAVQSIFTNATQTLPDVVQGEVWPLGVGLLDRIINPTSSRLFTARNLSTWALKAAIGNKVALPVSGTGYLSWGGGNSSGLSENPTAQEVEDALNGIPAMASAGGVDVSGGSGLFRAIFRQNGARANISGNADGYAPLSQWTVGTLTVGNAGRPAVQLIRLNQNPAAFANLTVDSSQAGAVETLQAGDNSHNEKWRFTLPDSTSGGYFTVSVDYCESALIPYGDDGSGFLAALEGLTKTGDLTIDQKYKIISFATGDDFLNVGAQNETGSVFVATEATPTTWTNGSILAPIGAGNVQVIPESQTSFVVQFINDMANTGMGARDIDGSALIYVRTKGGNVDLRVPGIQLLLNGAVSTQTDLEIEGTPPGGFPQKLYSSRINVLEGLIDQENMPPQPTPGTRITQQDTIPAGWDSVEIEFETPLATPPSVVVYSLQIQQGDSQFTHAIREGSITETGYIVDFSGTTEHDAIITTDATI